jgi:hypothetical protein
VVDGVVVHQSGQVDEFDHGCEPQSVLGLFAFDLARQQEQRRPEEFAAHEVEVLIHFFDVGEVRHDDAFDLVADAVEPSPDGCLDRRQLGRDAT